MRTGSYHFPTRTPLVLYLLVGSNLAFQETVFSIKIVSILLHVLLTVGTFGIVSSVTAKRTLGLLAIVLLNVSGLHLFLIVEFLNQLGSVAFTVCGFWFLVLFFEHRRLVWPVGALTSFALGTLSHKSALPIIFTLLVSAGLFLLAASARPARRWAARVTIILLFCSPAVFAAQGFVSLPLGLGTNFSIRPELPMNRPSTLENMILLFVCIFSAVGIRYQRNAEKRKFALTVLGTLVLWSTLISFNPFISSENGFLTIGGRLRILSYLLLAIALPVAISLMGDLPRFSVFGAAWLVPLVVLFWRLAFSVSPLGADPFFLERRKTLVEWLKSTDLPIEPKSMIIAAHGDQFVVTAITGIPSQQAFPANYRGSVYWLLTRVPASFIDDSAIVIGTDSGGSRTILLKDTEPFRCRLVADIELRLQLARYNRHLVKALVLDGTFQREHRTDALPPP